MGDGIIDSGGTYQLAYNNSLCAVDHKRTRRCHQRKISHENLVFIDLFCFLIDQSYFDFQRCRISHVALFTLLDSVFRVLLVKCKVDKFQAELSAVVRDRRDVIKYFFQPLIKEPLIGVFLDFDQIRHFQDFLLSLVAHTHAFSGFYRTNSVFFH